MKRIFQRGITYFMLGLIKLVSFIFFPIKVYGRENFPKEGSFLICPNHISAFDIVPVNLAYGKPIKIMAKKELFKNKFVGGFFSTFGAFAIDRGKADMAAINYAEDMLRDGSPVCIFVEGTRTKDPEARPGRAKAGAALIASQAAVPVVPVGVVYRHKRPRLFSRIRVYIGTPIPAEELTVDKADRGALRRATERIMSEITALWEKGTEQWQK